jgi:hypothetical protein
LTKIEELKKKFSNPLVDICDYLGLLKELENGEIESVEDTGFEIVGKEFCVDTDSISINGVIFKEL